MQGSLFFNIILEDIRQKTTKYSFKVDYVEQELSFLEELANKDKQRVHENTYSVTAFI